MSKKSEGNPLWAAAAAGDINALRRAKADINEPDDADHGRTAIHKAAAGGHDACITALQARGGDINAR